MKMRSCKFAAILYISEREYYFVEVPKDYECHKIYPGLLKLKCDADFGCNFL